MNFFREHLFELLMILTVAVGLIALMSQGQDGPAPDAPSENQHNQASQTAPTVTPVAYSGPVPDLLATKPNTIIRIAGSNTIGANLAPAIAEAYLRHLGSQVTARKPLGQVNETAVLGYLPSTNEVVAIEIKAHGSSTGFKALIAKNADLAMSSRPIKHQENLELILKHGDMTNPESEHILALDGLAIVTHKNNPITHLTLLQLAQVFSGEISSWASLGGPNLPISLYARDDQSGTYDTFKALVLKKYGRSLGKSGRFESNAKLVEAVSKDPGAIGFTGLTYTKPEMLVDVAAATGLPAIRPEQFSISSEDYPLARRLYLYANKFRTSNPHVKNFVEFALSQHGQSVVEVAQFIPQKITSIKFPVDSSAPASYQRIAMNGERLSMTFRMRADRAEIDNKSAQNIDHLVAYLKEQDFEKITLVGFSAGESNDEDMEERRAHIRSRLLAHELKQRGIRNVEIVALGDQLPIASNTDAMGRYKNNRTEIWLSKKS